MTLPLSKDFGSDDRVVICPPGSIGLGRKIATEESAELIVDQDCPPLSIYTMSREDYES